MNLSIKLQQQTLAQKAMCLDGLAQDKSILLQPSLIDVLAYHNQHIIDGLMSALDLDAFCARGLFQDGLRWLWYCNHHESDGCRNIDDPILILDEVWHIFMLYTPYYTQFCLTFFGDYLHHMPTLRLDEQVKQELSQEQYLAQKKQQLEKIYDLLGKDVFIRWYHDYPKRYNRQSLLAMRKK